MKRIALSMSAVAALAAAMILGSALPASATSAGVGVFTGTANAGPLASPLGSGCGGTVIAGPVEACPSSSGEGWNFAGGGVGAGVSNQGGTPHAGGPGFSAFANGSLNNGLAGGAWCGASGGSGGSGGAALGADTFTLTGVNWIQSAATVIPFSGTATENAAPGSTGVLAGAVSAVPPNPVTGGGSCLGGTGSTFIIVGVGAIAIP